MLEALPDAGSRDSFINSRLLHWLFLLPTSDRYTTKDSLQYVPLAELLATAAEEKPDLLVLCGPFVDINQSGITDGRLVELTHQEVFYERIVPQVNKFCLSGSPGTRVIMVPSERDVHHDFVFPQPPFSIPRDEVP